MSPLLGHPNRRPHDRTFLTLGIVVVVLLVTLLAMPFLTRARAKVPARGMPSHSTASAV